MESNGERLGRWPMAAPATLVVLQPHLIMRTMTKNNEFMVIHSYAGMLGNGQAEKSKIGIIGKQRLRECVYARTSPLSCFLLHKLKMV